jgi:hypothetical protein
VLKYFTGTPFSLDLLFKERDELRKVKQDLQRERQLLSEAIRKLEPDGSNVGTWH